MELTQLLTSYQELLKQDEKSELPQENSKIKSLIELDRLLPSGVSFMMLLDMKNQQIKFISENFKKVTGLEVNDFYDGGLPFYTNQVHPEDVTTWREILDDLMNHTVTKVLPEDHEKLCYSYNYRFKHANGNFINILESQVSTDFDEYHRPTISVGHFIIQESSSVMKSSIKLLNSSGSYQEIYTKNYFQNKKYDSLTVREKDVLKLIAEGNSTHDISEILSISSKTIENHRTKICSKLNLKSKNNSLLSYAIEYKKEINEL